MMQQQKGIKYTSGAIGWTVFILVSLLMPAKKLAATPKISIPGGDKLVHFVLFAVLTFLVVKSIQERKGDLNVLKIFVTLGLFALFTEFAQHFIVDRNADILDLAANIFGIVSILLILKNHFR